MAITAGQVSQVITGSQQIQTAAQAVLNYAIQVQQLIQSNWIQPTTIGGVTVNADFSGTTAQNGITATYSTLKAVILTVYNTLP